jgi:hypothetical protein
MRWKKGLSDTHVYDWQFFSLQDGSIGRLLVTGFLVGLVYAVAIVKVWPSLPGEEVRKLGRDWHNATDQAAYDKAEMCKQFPTSKACQPAAPVKKESKPDTCAADFAAWEAMPDTTSAEHNAKWTRRAELVTKHGTRNFKAGCSDQ